MDSHWANELTDWSHDGGFPWGPLYVDLYSHDVNHVCRNTTQHRATDNPLAGQRYHARLFDYGYTNAEPESGGPPNGGNGWHIHVGAHFEERRDCGGFVDQHVVPQNGFTWGRWAVEDGFLMYAHHPWIKTPYWGNTGPARQCDGSVVRGDGMVTYIGVLDSDPPPDPS